MRFFRFDDFELDAEMYVLRKGREEVAVEAKVFDFLLYLIRNRDRVVSRQEILSAVWPGIAVQHQSAPQALYAARRALSDDPSAPRYIQTVRGRGLRFIADVWEHEREATGIGVPAFVGREDILGALQSAVGESRVAEGRIFVVSGEAGIGKTRLASEFATRARAEGALVHVGRCAEAEGAPAYWPWVSLLRAHAPHAPASRLSALVEDAPVLGAIAPELAGRRRVVELATSDTGPARFQLFDAVTRFWSEEARTRPLVLIIDDLHRADDASRALLLHLARDVAQTRLVVVVTHREPDARAEREWERAAAVLTREPAATPVRLEGFTSDEVRAFLISARGLTPRAEEVAVLHERCSGNPFFLTQLLRLDGDNARDSSSAKSLPRTLSEAVTSQLDGLPEECRSLLAMACVIGRDFMVDVLREACREFDPTLDVARGLDRACHAGVVMDDPERQGWMRFSHILVRDAIYAILSAPERAEHHAAVGAALERRSGPPTPQQLAELAHHALESMAVSGAPRAFDFALRAGRASLAALAVREAMQQLLVALELAASCGVAGSDRLDLLLALGEAQARSYEREPARATLRSAAELAKELGQPESLARVALSIAPGFFAIEVGIVDPFFVSLLEESLALLPVRDSALRARLQARLAMALYWSDRGPRRGQLIDEAESTAIRMADPVTGVHVLSARISALWTSGNLQERLALADDLIDRAAGVAEWELVLIGRVYRITCLIEYGDLVAMEKELDAFERTVTDHAIPQARWYVDLYRGNLCLEQGDLEGAELRLARISEFATRLADSNIDHSLGTMIALIHWRRGDGSAFIEATKTLAARYPAVVAWRTAIALLSVDGGRRIEAEEILLSVLGSDAEVLPDDIFRVIALCVAGEVGAGLGNILVASKVRRLLEQSADRYATAGFGSFSWGSVSRVLGCVCTVLEDWPAAERYFARATAMESRAGSRAWLADTYREHARMLFQRGRREDVPRARELLASSLELGRSLSLGRTVRLGEELSLQWNGRGE